MKKINSLILLCLVLISSCGKKQDEIEFPQVQHSNTATTVQTTHDESDSKLEESVAEAVDTTPLTTDKKTTESKDIPLEKVEGVSDTPKVEAPSDPPSSPVNAETPDTSISSASAENDMQPEIKTVSIEVVGLNQETIFSAQAEYREEFTVFDLLIESAKKQNVPVAFVGGKSATYITGINGLFEKDNGPESGWIYTVNGEIIMKPCSKYILNRDDTVKWTYITHFGTVD